MSVRDPDRGLHNLLVSTVSGTIPGILQGLLSDISLKYFNMFGFNHLTFKFLGLKDSRAEQVNTLSLGYDAWGRC